MLNKMSTMNIIHDMHLRMNVALDDPIRLVHRILDGSVVSWTVTNRLLNQVGHLSKYFLKHPQLNRVNISL